MLHLIRSALCLLALLFSGCLQVETVMKLKPDGSGTIEEKVMMGGAMIAQMKSMAAAFGDKSGKGFGAFDEAKLKERAAQMGTGVTFVSGKAEKGADGGEGYSAVYAFTDVNKVKLSSDASDFGPKDGPVKVKSEKSEKPLTFAFTKGQPAKLVVNNPNVKAKAEKAEKADDKDDPAADAMLPMMKEMLKDVRVRISVEVAGKIVETNAQYADGSRVTFMDMEMNKILEDPVKFKALAKVKDPNSPEAKAALAKIPGIKVETAESVTIKFQ